jgi:hypothetical protein
MITCLKYNFNVITRISYSNGITFNFQGSEEPSLKEI